MSNSYSCVPPSLIRQYLYCPAAAYYAAAGLPEPPTERMARGRQIEREAVEALARRLGAEKVEHHPRLQGAGICGVVDAVLWIDKRPTPLEIKATKAQTPTPLHHKAQAAAYAVAAQHTYGKAATAAYIYYAESATATKIPLTKDLVELVKHATQQIQKIYKGWTPTPNPHPTKCPNCWYKKYCGHTKPKIETI